VFYEATIKDINKSIDLLWEMAQKPECCCYPIYYDGIKTKADMMASLKENVENGNNTLFIYEENGIFQGMIGYFEIREERYIQLNFCFMQHGTRNAMQALMHHLNEKIKGETIYFGFPEGNKEALEFMEDNCFEKIEESWNHSFIFSEYQERKIGKTVRKLTRETYHEFMKIYKTDAYTYWNADRIYNTFDGWNIYIAYEHEQPVSAVILQKGTEQEEIFGVSSTECMTEEHYEAMMNTALKESKERGVKYLTYFSQEQENGCLERLGFHCIGKYVLYIKKM